MKIQAAAAASGALLLAACAFGQQEPLKISSITVNTDLSAIQSRDAVDYWQDVSDDLETAIAAELAGSIDPNGHPVTVDIDELSLSQTYAAGAAVDNARLSGVVILGDIEPDGVPDPTYNVVATAQDVTPYLQQGNTVKLSATTPEYYDAIVKAFARGTAETLLSRRS